MPNLFWGCRATPARLAAPWSSRSRRTACSPGATPAWCTCTAHFKTGASATNTCCSKRLLGKGIDLVAFPELQLATYDCSPAPSRPHALREAHAGLPARTISLIMPAEKCSQDGVSPRTFPDAAVRNLVPATAASAPYLRRHANAIDRRRGRDEQAPDRRRRSRSWRCSGPGSRPARSIRRTRGCRRGSQ